MLTAGIVGSGAGRQKDAFSSDHDGRQISVNMDVKLLHLDDESLICRIQEGSHEAFTTLVDRHSNRFYRIVYRLVSSKDDAEDIVQEAFLKLWGRPNLWDPSKRAKFTTWFYRVVINLCFDHRKKKKAGRLIRCASKTGCIGAIYTRIAGKTAAGG